jgi:hypothetical protein
MAAGAKPHQITIAIPPYDQEGWIEQQLDTDPAFAAAFSHLMIIEDCAKASEWMPFGAKMFIRWAVSPEPPETRFAVLHFLARHPSGGYMAGAVSCENLPGKRLPWRRLHRLFSRAPDFRLAQLPSVAEAMAAVDDPTEVVAAWSRGCLGWRPFLDEGYEIRYAGTWAKKDQPLSPSGMYRKRRDAAEIWSRKTWARRRHAGAVLWVAGRRDKWVASVQVHDPNTPLRHIPRKRKLGKFATRDQAFAVADAYILNL